MTKERPGQRGEDLACDLLVRKGYQIVERNYTYGKGEVDIIAKDGEILVFVEVKSPLRLDKKIVVIKLLVCGMNHTYTGITSLHQQHHKNYQNFVG